LLFYDFIGAIWRTSVPVHVEVSETLLASVNPVDYTRGLTGRLMYRQFWHPDTKSSQIATTREMDLCGIAKYNIKSETQVFRLYVPSHSDTTLAFQMSIGIKIF